MFLNLNYLAENITTVKQFGICSLFSILIINDKPYFKEHFNKYLFKYKLRIWVAHRYRVRDVTLMDLRI